MIQAKFYRDKWVEWVDFVLDIPREDSIIIEITEEEKQRLLTDRLDVVTQRVREILKLHI